MAPLPLAVVVLAVPLAGGDGACVGDSADLDSKGEFARKTRVPFMFTMDMDLRLNVLVDALEWHIHVDDVYIEHRLNNGLDDVFFSRSIVTTP